MLIGQLEFYPLKTSLGKEVQADSTPKRGHSTKHSQSSRI